MKKIKYMIVAITVLALTVTGCASNGNGTSGGQSASTDGNSNGTQSEVEIDTNFTARDLEVGFEESLATFITLKDDSAEISGTGAKLDGNMITIQKEGTYVLQGDLKDGQIIVDVSDTEKVQLVLDGVSIHNSSFAPIYIKSGDKVFITLKEGSNNTLTDGTEYIQVDDNTVDGVIFSKADLTINGSGTLNITGSYKHGIVSKDDIVITGGTYNITAVKDAINGKDAVKIKDGIFTLSSDTGNGIQSKHDSNSKKGYVYIAGGTITVTKSQEGIEGTVVIIDNGVINIHAEDDGLNAASGSSDSNEVIIPTWGGAANEEGFPLEGTPPQGIPSDGQLPPWGGTTDGEGESLEGTPPQGMPSDGQLPPRSGTTDGEGASSEGEMTTDGQRRNPGNFGGGFGQADTNAYILINGGTIYINAGGDGIDSNGDLYITGGIVYVDGPTNGGDGAIDYDGKANVSGGIVVATGSVGMAYSFSDTSTQYSLLYNFSNLNAAGTEVKLTDENGTVLASFTPNNEYQSVVISTPEMKKDATYTITSGEQSDTITLTSIVTSNGQQGMGGFGGKRPTR